MWSCALSLEQTSSCGSCCQRRCYPCVVCGSPRAPLAVLWRVTWAPRRGSHADSLASATRGGESKKKMSMHCCGDVTFISSCCDSPAFEQRNQGKQDNFESQFLWQHELLLCLSQLKQVKLCIARKLWDKPNQTVFHCGVEIINLQVSLFATGMSWRICFWFKSPADVLNLCLCSQINNDSHMRLMGWSCRRQARYREFLTVPWSGCWRHAGRRVEQWVHMGVEGWGQVKVHLDLCAELDLGAPTERRTRYNSRFDGNVLRHY